MQTGQEQGHNKNVGMLSWMTQIDQHSLLTTTTTRPPLLRYYTVITGP